MANITTAIKNFGKENGITETCFNWCREQNIIHQNNLLIQDLSLPAIALFFLLINNLIYEFSNEIKKKLNISDKLLEKIYRGTSVFSFFLLAIFLIYIVGFK